jgi:CO dehydrogenase nickel-insertion accessory protein CooC1
VVLTQVVSGGGGVGKSQLAAAYAADAISTGTDLVAWADATQPGTVIDAFARAAR